MKRAMFAGAVIALLVLITVYFLKDTEYRPNFRISDNSYMENIRIVQKKAGSTRIVVNAERAIFETEQDVKLQNLTLYLPEKQFTLTAESGDYNTASRNVVIRGDIKARTKGYDISTDTLSYNSAKGELLTEDKVVIIGKERGFYMEGDVMTAQGDIATLHRNVKAVFGGKKFEK